LPLATLARFLPKVKNQARVARGKDSGIWGSGDLGIWGSGEEGIAVVAPLPRDSGCPERLGRGARRMA